VAEVDQGRGQVLSFCNSAERRLLRRNVAMRMNRPLAAELRKVSG